MISALVDVLRGMNRLPLAMMLAWRDIIGAHRRSLVGPVWIFLQTFIWVFFIGLLFGGTFEENSSIEYLIYVAIGMVVFNLVTTIISSSANSFTQDASLIKNIPIPPSVFVIRSTLRAVITMVFEFPVIILAMLWRGFIPPIEGTLYAFAGLILTIIAFGGAAWGIASLAARIRDVVPLVSVLVRFGFFATPIFWIKDSGSRVRLFLDTFNPISHFLDIVRSPILHGEVVLNDWLICLGMTAGFWILGLILFATTRDKLAALV